MRIKRVEIREIRLPLVHFFETSFGRTTVRRIVLVRAESDGIEGWGEVTCGEAPFYNYETPETARHILRDFLVPWALEREWESPSALAERFRPVRGHNMAKAALENACWDLEARRQGLPLSRLIGGTLDEIPCGVSIGIQNSVEDLLEKIEGEVAAVGEERSLSIVEMPEHAEKGPSVQALLPAEAASLTPEPPTA